MNALPTIGGTMANWPLNGTLVDISGNGLTLQAVDALTNAPVAAPTWVTFDSCTQAVDTTYDGGVFYPKLMAPVTPLLQLVGPMTIQWTMVQVRTFEIAYFACGVPGGPPISPDRLGSLYCVFSFNAECSYTDQHVGSSLPSAGYGYLTPSANANWAEVPGSPPPYAAPAPFAATRDSLGVWRCYRSGVLVGTAPAYVANVAVGTEQLFIGGFASGNSGGAQFANVRVLNYQRSDVQIAADAAYSLSACGSVAVPPVTDGSGGSSSFTNLVYDGVAAAQFATSLRQAPRS